MFFRFLPPAFGVAAGRLLRRGLSGTAAWLPETRTRLLLMTTKSPPHGSNNVDDGDGDGLSRMQRRLVLEEEMSHPGGGGGGGGRTPVPCDSRCGDAYRGFIAAMEGALRRQRQQGLDHGAQQSLGCTPSSSESEAAAAGGSGGSPAPAEADSRSRRRFGFLFRPSTPPEVDWVQAGAVSPLVRKQSDCGSCWAMAVVGAVEAAHYLETKQHVSLSVQELVDCDTTSNGCDGGWPGGALRYVRTNGLSSESSYPYLSRRSATGCCRGAAAAARISDFGVVSVFPTEGALERAVAKRPVVVILQSCDELRSYKGGVMEYRAKTYSDALRREEDGGGGLHAVLMVGYGTDDDGVKYWRFKNSWGQGWGEKGFGRIRRRHGGWRGVAGLCMLPAFYPVL